MSVEGYDIRIYDKERCVCDAFKFRNKIGIDFCSEIIDNYLARLDGISVNYWIMPGNSAWAQFSKIICKLSYK